MRRMHIKSEFKSVLKLDKRWSGIMRLENVPKPIRKASELFAHTGDSKFWFPLLILLWVFGNYFWKQWGLIMVLGIALARIAMGMHYPSDVIGGLLLGVLVGVLWLGAHQAALPLLSAGFLSLFHLPLS